MENQLLNQNFNYKYSDKFLLSVRKLQHVSFYCSSVGFPSLSAQPQVMSSPNGRYKYQPTKIDFSPLTVTFKVDEDLKNYIEVYNWMRENTTAISFDMKRKSLGESTAITQFSDVTIMSLNNHNLPNINFNFVNCQPISLGSLNYNVEDTNITICDLTLDYDYFEIR